jgi:ketosteroid isomerase-like protein
MKSVLSAALIVCAYATVGLGAQSDSDVLAAWKRFTAARQAGDKASFGRILTDDFTFVDRSGRFRNKADAVAELTALAATQPASPEIHVYGNGAVVVALNRALDGSEVRALQAWVKNGNLWKLAAIQGVPVGDKNVPPSTRKSSPTPRSSGSSAELQALNQALDATPAAIQKGDAKKYAASVTDELVVVGTNGKVRTKGERVKEVAAGSNQQPDTEEESSSRIYGNFAVTTKLMKQASGARTRRTIVSVKQGERWLAAAVATTRISVPKKPLSH